MKTIINIICKPYPPARRSCQSHLSLIFLSFLCQFPLEKRTRSLFAVSRIEILFKLPTWIYSLYTYIATTWYWHVLYNKNDGFYICASVMCRHIAFAEIPVCKWSTTRWIIIINLFFFTFMLLPLSRTGCRLEDIYRPGFCFVFQSQKHSILPLAT